LGKGGNTVDYSTHGIEKRRRQIRSNGPKAEKKFNFTIFRIFIISIIVIAAVGISAVIGGVKGVIDSAPELELSDVKAQGYKSYVYNKDGTLLTELVGAESNRIFVSIDEIPEVVQEAFIALEDERFLEHNGIDPKGMVRAFVVGLTSGGEFSEGASTITQQLLKLQVFSGGEEESLLLRFKRKFQEQYLALKLEEQMSKDEVLESYLNLINLGRGNYGVEAASLYYFNKSCGELTVSEAAVLSAIAQSPTNNNPVSGQEVNAARRSKTLSTMLDLEFITTEEYNVAIADDVYERINANVAAADAVPDEPYSYYMDAAIDQIVDDLQEKLGYSNEEATQILYGGGLQIYLAQDPAIQSILDAVYADNSNFPITEYLLKWSFTVYNADGTETNYYPEHEVCVQYFSENLMYSSEEAAREAVEVCKAGLGIDPALETTESFEAIVQLQSSFVVIDQSTGYVAALIGGRGSKNSSLSFNRATDAQRQPGSTFKIVSTYAPLLDQLGYSLSDTETDVPYVNKSDGTVIQNVDYNYEGTVTLKRAIIVSKNTVAAKLMAEVITPEVALEFLIEKMGFTTLDRERDAVTSLALGGVTYGVTNLELTNAFAAIANNGQYTKPILYTKILDSKGNVLIDNSVGETHTAVSESTAYFLTEAMQDVVTSGTGTRTKLSNMPTAGKTGTTNDYKDLWFVGYTPYYTAGIWFGYDNNLRIKTRTSNTKEQQVIWRNIMTQIHANLERKEFELPDSIITRWVCSATGKLAGSNCKSVLGYFSADNVPTEVCNDHIYQTICNVCGGKVTDQTPDSYRTTKQYTSYSNIPNYFCTHIKSAEDESETTTPPEGQDPEQPPDNQDPVPPENQDPSAQ